MLGDSKPILLLEQFQNNLSLKVSEERESMGGISAAQCRDSPETHFSY